ncbi:hypothetical protein HDU91_001668 [Kappamyces sp. JEL0680]|nr:hypothetical protein HDU91_001668 [Kappamyces sp. JEL0680]
MLSRTSLAPNRFWFRQQILQELLLSLRCLILTANDGSHEWHKHFENIIRIHHVSVLRTVEKQGWLQDWETSPFRTFDLCWGLGVLYMSQTTGQEPYLDREALADDPAKARLCKFLLKMSGLQPKLSEACLLELTLVYIQSGRESQALERLATYTPLFPYSENPELIGYAGLICYRLWKDDNEHNARYLVEGLEHLKASLLLYPHNSMFLQLYVEMCDAKDDLEGLERLLGTLLDKAPDDFYILKHACHFYWTHTREDYFWFPLAIKLYQIDPLLDLHILQYVALIAFDEETNGTLVSPTHLCCQLLEILATRLEHSPSDRHGWELLIDYTRLMAQSSSFLSFRSDIWVASTRQEWWPHFFASHVENDRTIEDFYTTWLQLMETSMDASDAMVLD